MVWTCYTSNRTCKDHHAGHSTRPEETRQTKKMLARQHQGMDGAASCQDPETSRRQRRLEKDHQNICGAPTAPQRLRAADADDDLCIRCLKHISRIKWVIMYVAVQRTGLVCQPSLV